MFSARIAALGCLTLFLVVCCRPATAGAADRVTVNFDRDWRFHLGEVENGQNAEFNDSSWRLLDVPHDWSIEGAFDQRSPAGAGGGYLNGGIGWYRKTFATPADAKGRRVSIEFDGVYMDSDVWLNGKHLGRHPYGYTSFDYDLTDGLKAEGQNVLAVRANVAQPCSRWYSGAGIFRHVRLQVLDPVHLARWGTYVSTPTILPGSADVKIATLVVNQGAAPAEVALVTEIIGPDGKVVSAGKEAPKQVVAAGGETTFEQTVSVTQPKLWSPASPELYLRHVARPHRRPDGRFHHHHFRHPQRRVQQGAGHADQRPAGAGQRRLRPPRPGLPRLGRPRPRHSTATGDPQEHGLQRHPHEPQPARSGPAGSLRLDGLRGHGRGLRRMEAGQDAATATAGSSTSGASGTS